MVQRILQILPGGTHRAAYRYQDDEYAFVPVDLWALVEEDGETRVVGWSTERDPMDSSDVGLVDEFGGKDEGTGEEWQFNGYWLNALAAEQERDQDRERIKHVRVVRVS